MDIHKDYYAILGVLPSVDDTALTAVYRALLKKYHPDVYQGPKEEAERKTREIIEAYGVLGNIKKRTVYEDARKKTIDPADYEPEDDFNYEPYVAEEWIDLNKINAARLAKARQRTLVVAALVAAIIIGFALGGQYLQQPAPMVASEQRHSKTIPPPPVLPQERSSQATSLPTPECVTRTPNGAIWTTSGISLGGPNMFEFVNQRSGNAIVKIRDNSSGAVVVSFYVAAGAKASFDHLPNGAFRIQYALGGNLAQDCRTFVHAYGIYQLPGTESFYNQKLMYTLSAEASPARNSRPSTIEAADFDAK